ncbi:hypothetical protein V8C86DRAFT_3166371 [Haematococcus lacustris]
MFVSAAVARCTGTSPADSGRSSGLQAYFQDSVNALLSSCFDAAAAPLRPIRVLVTADYAVPASIVAQLYTANTGISASVQSVAYSDLAFTLRQGLNMTGDTTAASSLYDLVMFSSSMMGELGSAGALEDLRPWILGDTEQSLPLCSTMPSCRKGLSWSDLGPYDNTVSPMYQQQVVGVPWTETPFLMYVNWHLLSSVYNISRPAKAEVGRLPFYPDTWQELLAVMRRVNATASDPVTGKPHHALCMRYNSDTSYLLHAVMASMMQTQGYRQGYIYDPLTLQPLTNTTAMQQALRIVWELTSFVRGFDTAVDSIDMAQCAIALAGASVFKSLNPVHSNAQFMGQLAMSPLPASTEVLDRSTMQLVPCTAQLCNSQRSSQLGGQLANLSPSRYQPSLFLGMSATVPRQMQSAVFNFMAGVSGPNMTKGDPLDQPGLTSWQQNGYNYNDVLAYDKALAAILQLPGTAMDCRVADKLDPMQHMNSALYALVGCSAPQVRPTLTQTPSGPGQAPPQYQGNLKAHNIRPHHSQSWPWPVPRSAGSPADFAAAMGSMTSGLASVSPKPRPGAAACPQALCCSAACLPLLIVQLDKVEAGSTWHGAPSLGSREVAIITSVSVVVCCLVVALLAALAAHWRRSARLQRSLLGHVLPPAAGPKATLVITDVQGSSRLWEVLPAGVMEASMKAHDNLVRGLALHNTGYEFGTEGDSFLLCFHSPEAAVTFAMQLQDGLLQGTQWLPELLAAGSPAQPLHLAPVQPGSHAPLHALSTCTSPASSTRLVPHLRSDRPSRLKRVHSLILQLAHGASAQLGRHRAKSQPMSLGSFVGLGRETGAVAVSGQPAPHINPVFSFMPDTPEPEPGPASPTPSQAAPPTQSRGSRDARGALWCATEPVGVMGQGLAGSSRGRLMPLAGASAAAAPITNPVEGLLGLLAHLAWSNTGQRTHQPTSSTLDSSAATEVGGRDMDEAAAASAAQGRVVWQRLCELYREVEQEAPAALCVLAGLRVRVGLHSGLAANEVLVQSRMGASSTTYGGAALALAKAVQACAHGGQVALSADTFLKLLLLRLLPGVLLQLPMEELRAAGISVVHMGQHLVALGEGKPDTALDLYCATLHAPAHAHRLWALGPLSWAATAFMSVAGLAHVRAWDADLAQRCLSLYHLASQHAMQHVTGPQLPVGYLVSSVDADGMVVAAFPSSLQCLHWALLTLNTCKDLDWPQALLDNPLGEEMAIRRYGHAGDAFDGRPALATADASNTIADNGDGSVEESVRPTATADGLARTSRASVPQYRTVRLLRGLRLKVGVDVGEVACDLTPANGRFNYRGRCLNRAARINSIAETGQASSQHTRQQQSLVAMVWCSEAAWADARVSLQPEEACSPAPGSAAAGSAVRPVSAASWSAQGCMQDSLKQPAKSVHSATAAGKQGIHSQHLTLPLRPQAVAAACPAPGPASLDVSAAVPCPHMELDTEQQQQLAVQWRAVQQQQLHGSTQPSAVAPDGSQAAAGLLLAQGQPVVLPGLLPALVAQPLGEFELRGIPGQVALLQVALAPHSSKAQLSASHRLGLTAPGLRLSKGAAAVNS